MRTAKVTKARTIIVSILAILLNTSPAVVALSHISGAQIFQELGPLIEDICSDGPTQSRPLEDTDSMLYADCSTHIGNGRCKDSDGMDFKGCRVPYFIPSFDECQRIVEGIASERIVGIDWKDDDGLCIALTNDYTKAQDVCDALGWVTTNSHPLYEIGMGQPVGADSNTKKDCYRCDRLDEPVEVEAIPKGRRCYSLGGGTCQDAAGEYFNGCESPNGHDYKECVEMAVNMAHPVVGLTFVHYKYNNCLILLNSTDADEIQDICDGLGFASTTDRNGQGVPTRAEYQPLRICFSCY